MVYDVTTYLTNLLAVRTPTGMQAPGNTDINFMHGSVLDLFKFNVGRDITNQLDHLNIDSTILARQKVSLCNLGKVDSLNVFHQLYSLHSFGHDLYSIH
jgi:chitin synthase